MWGHAFMRVGCQEELGYNDSGFFMIGRTVHSMR